MTHLEQAQDRLKVELEAQPHCSGFRDGAEFVLGILDEQEKPKGCEHEMIPRLKCNKPKGHEGSHSTDEIQPTPVPEELECAVRLDWPGQKAEHAPDNRELMNKINEVIRYLRQRSKE